MNHNCGRLTPGIFVAGILVFATAWAQQTSQAPSPPSITPDELVRKVVDNEVRAANDTSAHYMLRSRKETSRGSETKLYVETAQAMAGLVVAYDDQPLTPEQRRSEEAREERFLRQPQELKHKQNQEKADAQRILHIVKALPDAFLYEYEANAPPAQSGESEAELVRLRFRPNPKYQPPSRVEQVLTGMQGFLLIDTRSDRIAKIEATLFKEVSFGWGILGHLDKGGHFLVEQTDVGNNSWQITHMNLSFTGKILLLKNLTMKSDEVSSDFRSVPADLTFAQGVELLEKEAAMAKETPQTSEHRADPK